MQAVNGVNGVDDVGVLRCEILTLVEQHEKDLEMIMRDKARFGPTATVMRLHTLHKKIVKQLRALIGGSQ